MRGSAWLTELLEGDGAVMKTMRYAAGAAVGLVAPALAFTGTAAAQPAGSAHGQAHGPAAKTKTVRLRPESGAYCVGQTKWEALENSQALSFWYANYGTHSHCIGTVIAELITDGRETSKPEAVNIDIYTGGTLYNSFTEEAGPGSVLAPVSPNSPDYRYSWTFRSAVSNPVKVCAYWHSRRNGDIIGAPVCKTLG